MFHCEPATRVHIMIVAKERKKRRNKELNDRLLLVQDPFTRADQVHVDGAFKKLFRWWLPVFTGSHHANAQHKPNKLKGFNLES